MNVFAARVAPVQPFVTPAVAVSFLLVAVGLGPLGIVPMGGLVGLAFLLAAPMQWTALGLLAVALVVDNPGERPAENKWMSPLRPVGDLIYENLRKATGIDALRFSALEVLILFLLLIVIARKLRKDAIDDPLGLGALPNPMKIAFAAHLAVMLWLFIYGLGRGGDFKQSLWQARVMFWLPAFGVFFGHALKSAGARVGLLRVILAAAVLRAIQGSYTKWMVFVPAGITTEYVTTHGDTVLAVMAMLIAACILVERFTLGHLLLNVVVQPIVLLGIIANDRRVAFVSLGIGLLSLVGMGPAILRVLLRRSLLVAVPLVILYIGVGWHSSSPIFKPVETLKSVASKDDASNQTRDIENYNLTLTLKRNPLFGSGFGHEYYEFIQAYRVDGVFAQYRFIAHNSVLWLISIAGVFGMAVLWGTFAVSVMVARRAHRHATSAVDRTTAFAAVMAVMCLNVQAFADMGLVSWMGMLTLTSLVGATGALRTAQTRAAMTAL